MGKHHTCKDEAIELIKQGVSTFKISKDFDIPLATVQWWYKLEREKDPTLFRKIEVNKKISYNEINNSAARIYTLFSPYMKDLDDSKNDYLQEQLSKELKNLAEEYSRGSL